MKKFIVSYIVSRVNNIHRWIAIIKLHKLMISVRDRYDINFPRVYSKVKRDYKTYLKYHDFLEKNSEYFNKIDYKSIYKQGTKEYLDKLHTESNEFIRILQNVIDTRKDYKVLSKTGKIKCKEL